MPATKYAKDYSAFTSLVPPNTKPASGRLEGEINDSAIATPLDHIETNDSSSKCDIWFDDALSSGDQTLLDGLVAAHTGIPLVQRLPLSLEAPLVPVETGVSDVIANGRPAVEIQPGVTGFGGTRMTWPAVDQAFTKLYIFVKFIMKAAGTGSNVRLALKAKSNATGSDTSGVFNPISTSVVVVNYDTIGEVFEGELEADLTEFSEGDAVALQIGRDGNNEIPNGPDDDSNKAIQMIATTIGVK